MLARPKLADGARAPRWSEEVDGHEVGRVEGGRVRGDRVVVGVRVAGGRDDEDVGGRGRRRRPPRGRARGWGR